MCRGLLGHKGYARTKEAVAMSVPMPRLIRVVLSTAIGVLLGALTWAVAGLLLRTPLADLSIHVYAGALIGVFGAVGYDIGRRAARRSRTLIRTAGSLIALGLIIGGAVGALEAGSHAATTPGQVLLAGAFWLAVSGFSLLGGLALGRRPSRSLLASGVADVAFGLLSGVAFGIGAGISYALTYTPICTPHQFCIEPGPAEGFRLGFTAGPIIGLWLAVVLWLALATASIARPHEATGRGLNANA